MLGVWLRVTFRAEKMQRDIGLIAYHPTVVARSDVKQIALMHLLIAPILHSTGGAAGHNHSNMFYFA